MVGGRGLCSIYDAAVMGCLLPGLVLGTCCEEEVPTAPSLVLGSHVSPVAGLGDCLAEFFIWDYWRVCVDRMRAADALFAKL